MRCAVLTVALLATVTAAESAVIRVAPGGNDANPGASWVEAKRTVGAAIAAANAGDEIWVAAGTYDERIRNPRPRGSRWTSRSMEASRGPRRPASNGTSWRTRRSSTAGRRTRS